jgi:hypothetical protein
LRGQRSLGRLGYRRIVIGSQMDQGFEQISLWQRQQAPRGG